MALRGIDFVIQVKDGATWRTVAGQRGGTFSGSTSEIDATSKDGSGWEEKLVGLKAWSLEGDALHSETDPALTLIETQWLAGNTILCRWRMPSGAYYEGTAIISDFSIEGPHDGLATASITLSGTGAIVKG